MFVAPGERALALSAAQPSLPATAATPGAGPATTPIDVAGGGAAAGSSPLTTAPWFGAAPPDACPPVVLDDDGVPLSAEVAASPFSPPATARHAAFLKLVDHKVKAGLQSRHTRGADFSALAAEAGLPLFGDESLIVANLRADQALSLSNQATEEWKRGRAGEAEAEVLRRRAWVVLLAQALPIIQRRMDKGTLLPGKIRKVEEAYHVHKLQTFHRVKDEPAPPAEVLFYEALVQGYAIAMHAAWTALNLLPRHPWRADQRSRAQAFVLAAVRLIPKTLGLPHWVASEHALVNFIKRYVTPERYGADFCASLLAAWRSPAVADVLRGRGSLEGSAATAAGARAEFASRQQANLAKHGLRRCALPSCGRQETTVLQFRVCGHCQTTRYCCPEHAKLHWRSHKLEYEEEEGNE